MVTKLHHRTRRRAASRRLQLRHRQLANHTHSDLECLVVVSLCIRPAEADQVTFRTALTSTVTSNLSHVDIRRDTDISDCLARRRVELCSRQTSTSTTLTEREDTLN